MLHDSYFDRLGLVIPHFDLKRFIDPPRIVVGPELHPAALPGHVKRAAGIQPESLVLWRVVNIVLAREFQLPIIVAPVEAHSPFWQRHPQMIPRAVFELLHHPYFW